MTPTSAGNEKVSKHSAIQQPKPDHSCPHKMQSPAASFRGESVDPGGNSHGTLLSS